MDGIWCPAEDATDVFESSTLRVELCRLILHRVSNGERLARYQSHYDGT